MASLSDCYAEDEMWWPRLASAGMSLTIALLAHGCGSPPIQASGIDVEVRLVGGPTIVTQPRILVNLTAQTTGFSESRQVVTGDYGISVRMDLPPGRYQVTEVMGGNGPCSNKTVEVTAGKFESAQLSCDIR